MNKGLVAATAIGLAALAFPQAADAQQQDRRYGERAYERQYGDRYETPQYGDERLSDRQLSDCKLDRETENFLISGQLLVRFNGQDQYLQFMRPLAGNRYGYVTITPSRLNQAQNILEKYKQGERYTTTNAYGDYVQDYVYQPYSRPDLFYTMNKDISRYIKTGVECPVTIFPPISPRDQGYRRNNQDGYRPYQ